VSPSETTGMRVGFVGAGRIGTPMVQRLVGAGFPVSVFARRPEVRERLSSAGAHLVADVGAVATGNDLVICCLYSDDQLLAVADDIVPQLEPGSVLVSHTTGSPNTISTLAVTARRHGADAVDAAFSGTADDVRAGALTVLLGGRAESVDRCEPVLRAYAGTVIRTGRLGSALTLKLLNNVVFAANVQVALEVARFAEQVDIPLADVLAVLHSSSGGTKALDYLAAFGDAAAYAQQVRPFMVKDVAVYEQVATSIGLDLGLLGAVVQGGSMDVSSS
jgi:3-hydroxyisobutyrate dehydrogenase-like beta-hydroxyacid dehydrogenase